MEHVSSAEVLSRIDVAARASGKGALAFDGDGTLWDGDVGDDFFFALVAHGDVRPPAVLRMREEARAHELDDGGDGVALARRLYDAYTRHAYPERDLYALTAWFCAGWARGEVERFAASVIPDMKERLHPEALAIATGARQRGHRTVLVSASPRPIVEVAARHVGFTEIVATTPRWQGEVMLAAVDEPIPFDDGKVKGLRALVGETRLLAAFGDNAFDVAMLREAAVAVAVRPKPRLVARAQEVPGLLQIDGASV